MSVINPKTNRKVSTTTKTFKSLLKDFTLVDNILVPKHTIMSKIDVQNLLTTYNCSMRNLPTIKRNDAQAKYIGLKPKQVCEILVNNITSGIAKKYRVCEM